SRTDRARIARGSRARRRVIAAASRRRRYCRRTSRAHHRCAADHRRRSYRPHSDADPRRGGAVAMKQARYPLYFVPPAETGLYQFGAHALGYDCYDGRDLPNLSGDDLSPEEMHTLTAEPRTYGFHATLKPPFYLHETLSESDLLATL